MVTLEDLERAERRLEHRLDAIRDALDTESRIQMAKLTIDLVHVGNRLGNVRRQIAGLRAGSLEAA